MAKISVVVPVYKAEEYLSRCIESILNQTFEDFDLILVDDGSPDHCGKICDEYAKKDGRIVVIHKENGGRSDARNKGIDWSFANSKSEWITFVDSDDWVHQQFLELMYRACMDHSVQMSSCGFEISYGDESNSKTLFEKAEIDIEYPGKQGTHNYEYNVYNTRIVTCRLYHKSLWENFRFPLGKIHEDEYTAYKLIFACDRIAIVKANLYYYYHNPNSIMNSVFTKERMDDTLNAFLERADYLYHRGLFFAFEESFLDYCRRVEKNNREYKQYADYKKILKKHQKNIKTALKKYHDHLPRQYQKWGGYRDL